MSVQFSPLNHHKIPVKWKYELFVGGAKEREVTLPEMSPEIKKLLEDVKNAPKTHTA